MSVSQSIIALASLANVVHGFVHPTAFAAKTVTTQSSSLTGLHGMPSPLFDVDVSAVQNQLLPLTSLSLADAAGFGVDPSVGSNILSGLSSVATFVGGVVLFFVVLSVIVSTFIIPAAAKELEDNVRTKYPDLWQEYSAKLEAGEDFSMRPDLIQELGSKVQTLQMEEFDRVAKAAESSSTVEPSSGSSGSSSAKSDVIDVEVTKD